MKENNEIALEKYEAIIKEAKHFASVVRRYVAPTKEDDFCSRSELMNELNDLERAIHRGFLAAGVENVPVGIIKETANECLSQMKPADWSEEDEKIRRNLMSLLANMRGDRITEETYQKYYPWLKSLRPSWKPSENQMSMLLAVVNDPNNAGSESCHLSLKSLYNDLKKL